MFFNFFRPDDEHDEQEQERLAHESIIRHMSMQCIYALNADQSKIHNVTTGEVRELEGAFIVAMAVCDDESTKILINLHADNLDENIEIGRAESVPGIPAHILHAAMDKLVFVQVLGLSHPPAHPGVDMSIIKAIDITHGMKAGDWTKPDFSIVPDDDLDDSFLQ